MSKFFINRPIVAIVIAILMTMAGIVATLELPTQQFPNIADPIIQVKATYPGADAQTIAESVATPIEQQMSGVNGMNYMYSLSASSGGGMTLYVDYQLGTDVNTDQILSQMRQGQATSQLPTEVNQQGVVVQPGTTAPFMLLDLYSPNGAYDSIFLANYATINLQYALTRIQGVGQVQIFGAGPYAMRIWVNPDRLASLGVTVSDISNAVRAQNKVNPAGQIGGEPVPPGQQFTYNVRAPGRLPTAQDFGEIVVRAQPDGSILRLKDVARVELGSQYYSFNARLGTAGQNKPAQPAALIALYLTPGSNALQTRANVLKMMEEAKGRFPQGLDYITALDTTLAVSAGIREIYKTLFEPLVLVSNSLIGYEQARKYRMKLQEQTQTYSDLVRLANVRYQGGYTAFLGVLPPRSRGGTALRRSHCCQGSGDDHFLRGEDPSQVALAVRGDRPFYFRDFDNIDADSSDHLVEPHLRG